MTNFRAKDGFIGTVVGTYITRDGVQGVVLQQVGTQVVHVYRMTSIEEIKEDHDGKKPDSKT